jgi:hypothetical protein
MLESTCECGFKSELSRDDIPHQTQAPMPLGGGGAAAQEKYRIDFLLHGRVAVELKGCPQPPLKGPGEA